MPAEIGEYKYLTVYHKWFSFYRRLLLLMVICVFPFLDAKAQENPIPENVVSTVAYDDFPVLVIVMGSQNFYVNILYGDNNLIYVNIQELFSAVHIPCLIENKGNRLSGFIDIENNSYVLEFDQKQLKVGNKTFQVKDGLIKENGMVFLESTSFAEYFGLDLKFNFRSLTMALESNFELPIIRQQRKTDLRKNISKLQGEQVADTLVGREYHLFKPGVFDWSLASFQDWRGQTDNLISIGVGAELFNGEANIQLKYYDRYKFDSRQLFYLWRWVDNDKKIIKQAQVGRISNNTISYLNSPMIGGLIRNASTTLRKAEGFYTITEFTEPDWTVELYINNILVDFTKADASGLYTFKIPMVYGYTSLKLKFYGPLGEERSEERTMNIPYTIMPKGKFEYSLSAGLLQDSLTSRFGRAEFNYGVNKILTIGGGLEYLSSISNTPTIPFAQFTLHPFSKMTIFGEYAHGVRARGLLNYYFKKNALLEIDYAKYVEGQQATLFNALEERKVRLSVPIRFKSLIGFIKFDYSESIYKSFTYTQTHATISAYYRKVSVNSGAQLNWIDFNTAFVTTDLSMSYRIGKGYMIRPSVKYNLSDNYLLSYKMALEKNFANGNFSVSYEKNASFTEPFISLNIKYDLPFARTNFTATQSYGSFHTSESVQGSLAFGSGNNYIVKGNNSAISKGGIALHPFLDLNNNGVFDDDEHMIKLNSVRVMGSKALINDNDSIVRIPDLNAFVHYRMEFDNNDLNNIAWRFKYNTYDVLIDPNQFKRIDIPIIAVGEVSGMAYQDIDNSLKGLGRILVNFYNKKTSEKVAETLSEYDGYIYYLGLEPGDYFARLDSIQMSNLGFLVKTPKQDFTIRTVEDGDIIEGIDFTMGAMNVDTVDVSIPIAEESKDFLLDEIVVIQDSAHVFGYDTIYKVQMLALSKQIIIEDYFKDLLKAIPDLAIEEILGEDGLYHYSTVMSYNGIVEAHNYQKIIRNTGWADSFVAIYANLDKTPKRDLVDVSIPIAKESKDFLLDEIVVIQDSAHVFGYDTIYKVQMLALSKQIIIEDYFKDLLKAIPDLAIEEILGEDGLYHYSTVMSYNGIEEAHNYQKIIRNSGWADSFVAIYANEKRADKAFIVKLAKMNSLIKNQVSRNKLTTELQEVVIAKKEAKEETIIEQKVPTIELRKILEANLVETISLVKDTLALLPNDTLYKVHLLALRVPIRVKGYFTRLKSDLPGITIEETLGENKYYQYTTGPIRGMEQARELMKLIKESGWETCFLVTYTLEKGDEPIFKLKRK